MAAVGRLLTQGSRCPGWRTVACQHLWRIQREAPLRELSVSLHQRKEDKVTHTGQKWEDDDYRNVRFVDREKMVNEQFAIDLLAEEPVAVVKGTHTWCDGGRAALGHPRVYINLDKPEINDCGYCGKRFISETNKKLFPNEKFVSE